MRVALITDGIWPYVLGGMQKHSYYLCKYLSQNKIQVDLFHFNQSQYNIQQLEFFSDEEKQFIRSILVEFPKSLPFPGHYLYNSYRYSKRVYELIKDNLNDYDLIYTKGFAGWHLINQKYFKKTSSPPIAVKFHGYEMFQKAPDFKIKLQHLLLLRAPVKQISKRADLVFSYGGKITNLIIELGVKKNKIIELPSGVETSVINDRVQAVHTPLRFLYLGRYERRKGIEELNKVLVKLLSEEPKLPFEMHFVGPIPKEKQIQSPRVFYHGEIRDRQELQTKIRNCDVLLCPSWSEGFPNVILEAMANGLTVMATDVGAINVLVNNENGFLISKAEPEVIEDGLRKIIHAEPEAIQNKKQNALNTIQQKFTWEKLIQDLIKTIEKVKIHKN